MNIYICIEIYELFNAYNGVRGALNLWVPELNEFDKYLSSYQDKSSSFLYLLRMYKKTLRLLISHLNDLLFPEQNVENWNFYDEM